MDERITVGPPFFNKWMVPIGLVLLFLTGVGPLIAWRKATVSHLRYQFIVAEPGAPAATIAICLAAGWATRRPGVICFGFCAFTAPPSPRSSCAASPSASATPGRTRCRRCMGMVIRGKRRYGGYIVHVGIVLMFIGFAGTAYKKESDVKLVPGADATVGKYTLHFNRLAHEEDRQKEMVTGEVTAFKDGKVIDHLRPAKWFFHGHESEPTTEVAIRRAPDRGPLPHAGQLRPRRGERHAQGGGQPRRRLDLVRVHAAGDRDRASRSCPRPCSSG